MASSTNETTIMTTIPLRTIALDERGVAWIAGTGIKVKEVAIEKVVWGMTPEDMLAAHPHWSLPQIYAALSYYYDHQAEVDEQIERDRQWTAAQRTQHPNPFTREELVRRLPISADGGVSAQYPAAPSPH